MNKKIQILTLIIGLLGGINSDIVLAQNNPNYLAINQIEEAQQFYQQGDFTKAISVLKTAINNYEKEGNILGQTQSLINLSLIYLKQSDWQQTETNINQALSLIPNINNQEEKNRLTNFVLEIKGELQLAIAEPEIALKTWQQSSQIAYNRGDIQQFIYAEIKQIQALQELGMYGKAVDILRKIEPKLEDAPQDLVIAKAWQTIGDLSLKFGQIELAKKDLDQALNIAQQYDNKELVSDIFLSQGNVALREYQTRIRAAENTIAENEAELLRDSENLSRYQIIYFKDKLTENRQKIQEYLQEINSFYQKAASVTNNPSAQVIAQLAELNLFVEYGPDNIPANLIPDLANKINNLPPNKTLINNRINLAANLIKLNQPEYNALILEQLTKAEQESKLFNYERGTSNVFGHLGILYQQSQRLTEAKTLTEKALSISQQINAPDLTYQWQWQLGRIARQQNQRQEAIIAYEGAVNTLKSLRSELVGVNSDLQFNFRTDVEPVYRQLVDILLQSEVTKDEEIRLARDVIESLQIAELDNYFRDACLDVKEVDLDKVADDQTAVFYPIILQDRIEVIVSLPNDKVKSHSTKIRQDDLEKQIETLINDLQQVGEIEVVHQSLNRFYNI